MVRADEPGCLPWDAPTKRLRVYRTRMSRMNPDKLAGGARMRKGPVGVGVALAAALALTACGSTVAQSGTTGGALQQGGAQGLGAPAPGAAQPGTTGLGATGPGTTGGAAPG